MTRLRIGLSLAVLVLVWGCLAGVGTAGELYDSMSPSSPKIRQSDDTIVSDWDEVAGARKVTSMGGAVRSTTMASAVTTDTTTAPVTVPTVTKTFYGSVDGTGAVAQTQIIYGGLTSGVTATTGEPICTFTLSGTTHAHGACVSTAPWLFYIVVTAGTAGTGASGQVIAQY
jgi:hypothetical protein